jgi:hypothetical protein
MPSITKTICDHREPTSTLAWKNIAPRYFNAAGADPEGQLGERHDPESIIEDAWKWECREMTPTELLEPQRRAETPEKTPARNKPAPLPFNSMDYDKQPSEAEGK